MNKQSKRSPNQTIALKHFPSINKIKQETEYFIVGPGTKAKRVASAETMLKMHDEYSTVFTNIGCFKGAFPYR